MTYTRLFVLLLCASIVGGLVSWQLTSRISAVAPAAAPAGRPRVRLRARAKRSHGPAALTAEVTRSGALRLGLVASGCRISLSNLWFAGSGELAAGDYISARRRNHIGWMIRIYHDEGGERRPSGFTSDLAGWIRARSRTSRTSSTRDGARSKRFIGVARRL